MHTDYLILPNRHRLLQTQARSQIYGQHRRGDSVEALARQFSQPPTTIRRIINAMRAAYIMQLPLDHIGNAQFAHVLSRKVEVEILGPPPESNLPTKKPQPPKNVSAYVASLYEVPLLTFEQEVHLFRKMNYLKYKASALRADRLEPTQEPVDGPDREAVRRNRGDQEPNHRCQPSVGGLDRQAARGSGGRLLRAGQRRKHVSDQGGGQV